MNKKWNYPGARWWKFDFHTHTPASKDTIAWQKSIGTPEELKPETWLLKYMAAEIDCVAVTDHNSGEWIDKLKTVYAGMKSQVDNGNIIHGFRELHLFPGVEISVQGGVHLLAIFDPKASSQTISDLLAKVGYRGTRGDSDSVTEEGAAKVVEIVLREGGIAIPAHADGPKGLLQVEPNTHKCLLDSNTIKQILGVPGLLAIEWLKPNSFKPTVFEEMNLNLASVVGSDCHSFQGSNTPGSRYTWIKMAEPSLEGLRLALLDGQEVSVRRSDVCDAFTPFKKPEHFIESIEIKNARFMGRGDKPVRFFLNPFFNALIGGRGTGKSTVIHALRLAYRRENELLPGTEAELTFNGFRKVANNRSEKGGLLIDTNLSIQVNRDGISHRLLWQQGVSGSNVVEEWDASIDSFKPAANQIISEQRFPIRLFSQGQIAALAGDSDQALMQIIDAAANTEKLNQEFIEVKQTFFTTQAKIRELGGKLSGRQAWSLSMQDVQRKLDRFEMVDHATMLKNYQLTSMQASQFDRQFEEVADLVENLKDFATTLTIGGLSGELFDTDVEEFALLPIHRLAEAVNKAKNDIEQVGVVLNKSRASIKEQLETSLWFKRFEEARLAYDTLKADLQEQGVKDPNEYERLVQEKQTLEREGRELDAFEEAYNSLNEKIKLQLENIKVTRKAISANRARFLQSTLSDNPYVRIELVPYSRDIYSIKSSLKNLLGVADDKYIDDFYQGMREDSPAKGLVADLMNTVELSESSVHLNTELFENGIQEQKERLINACKGANQFGAWFSKFLKAEADKRPEYIDHIQCWFPDDGLNVLYSRKGDGKDFQSINQASAGQRAAAMLAFLLSHGNEPLVLDQPEDDLDNHLIYGLVVQQIRTNKLRRQLIIVTHNPNIVVNGDAEFIHALDFNNQCNVTHQGSLQDKRMRSEVCKIMEGGEEAFERRYQRLGREI